jgi:hypothetical protein
MNTFRVTADEALEAVLGIAIETSRLELGAPAPAAPAELGPLPIGGAAPKLLLQPERTEQKRKLATNVGNTTQRNDNEDLSETT